MNGREREPACWVVATATWIGAMCVMRDQITDILSRRSFPFMAEEAEMQSGWDACSQFKSAPPTVLTLQESDLGRWRGALVFMPERTGLLSGGGLGPRSQALGNPEGVLGDW